MEYCFVLPLSTKNMIVDTIKMASVAHANNGVINFLIFIFILHQILNLHLIDLAVLLFASDGFHYAFYDDGHESNDNLIKGKNIEILFFGNQKHDAGNNDRNGRDYLPFKK